MSRERGAAAVEFALVSVLLVTLLLGICEFGWVFLRAGLLANGAREGARIFAISHVKADAIDAAEKASQLPLKGVAFTTDCATVGDSVTVTVTYDYQSLTGIIPGFEMSGKGTMRCGG